MLASSRCVREGFSVPVGMDGSVQHVEDGFRWLLIRSLIRGESQRQHRGKRDHISAKHFLPAYHPGTPRCRPGRRILIH